MNIQSLNHCGLLVADLEKSRWFYGTVLGMEEVPRPKTFKFAGAWFRSGSCEVHLLLAKDQVAPVGFGEAVKAARPAFAAHLAFNVPDFDEVIATLAQYGYEIKFGPIARGDGMMQLFIHDPDGYLLEFYSWVKGSELNTQERGPLESLSDSE